MIKIKCHSNTHNGNISKLFQLYFRITFLAGRFFIMKTDRTNIDFVIKKNELK